MLGVTIFLGVNVQVRLVASTIRICWSLQMGTTVTMDAERNFNVAVDPTDAHFSIWPSSMSIAVVDLCFLRIVAWICSSRPAVVLFDELYDRKNCVTIRE